MPDRRNKRNAVSCNQSARNIEEALWRLKIHDSPDQGGMAQSNPYPDRPGERDCLYYLRTGQCGYGKSCRYNHPPYSALGTQFTGELPERDGQPECEYYLKTGTCKYGSTCKFHHPKDRNGAGPISFNILGLPLRQDEKSCPYYMRTGSCKFGVACKFNHPQSSSVGNDSPQGGSVIFGSTGSLVIPPSNLPFVGFPTWSLPRAPYVSSPSLQSPQAYMPVVVSPPQDVLLAHGWNDYDGKLSPVSTLSTLGTNLGYNSGSHVGSSSNGQVHFLLTDIFDLPERPDQPECRHFMSTGTCKYGSDCKYHHPKERVVQLANSASPLGLPSRPGQAVCSNYLMHGICKFGLTCRCDHPFPALPYGYGLSFAPLSVFDSSLLTYPRISSTIVSYVNPPSLRFPNWVQSSEGASEKNLVSGTDMKTSDDPIEATGSPPPHFPQFCSESSHD